jgi:hypothetical protein
MITQAHLTKTGLVERIDNLYKKNSEGKREEPLFFAFRCHDPWVPDFVEVWRPDV